MGKFDQQNEVDCCKFLNIVVIEQSRDEINAFIVNKFTDNKSRLLAGPSLNIAQHQLC